MKMKYRKTYKFNLIISLLITVIIVSVCACSTQESYQEKVHEENNREGEPRVKDNAESNALEKVSKETTFKNPIRDRGADPYVYKHTDGYYYYTYTSGNKITLAKSKTLTGLKNEPARTVWTPPFGGKPNSMEIWAPEIHFLDGKWYIYYAARGPDRGSRRMFVLENSSEDPIGRNWEDKGKICDPSDEWAIDGTVFESEGKMYFVWSGMEKYLSSQNIYIAEMSNPYTISSERVKISSPDYEWEQKRNSGQPIVNEGPAVLKRDGKIFIVYSASHYTTDDYCLGMLTADEDSDLLNPESWKKSEKPVFQKSIENKVYGPGHNSFTKSPDGKEDWIVYHAYSEPASTSNRTRSARIQKFTWDDEGNPVFGEPLPINVEIELPSGE